VDALIVLSRFIHFTALVPLFGGSLFRLCVEPQQDYGRNHSPRMIDIAASLAVLISAVAWLVGVAATMTGGWGELLVPSDTVAVLLDTQFGRVWILRLALAAGILGLVVLPQKRTRAWERAMLLFSGALTASLAAVGHGSFGNGLLRYTHFFGDAIHLLCAAAWLGGLIGLTLLLRQAVSHNSEQFPGFIDVAVARFSRLGYVTVGLLLATGVLNTISIVPRPELLVTSEYGRILLIKIGLVALMVGIALANRFLLTPQLQKTERAQARQASIALYRSVAVEQVLGLLVLAIVAILGTIHPTL